MAEIDDTLTDHEWLCALARSLVRDEHSADDRVQDTWLQSIRHGHPSDDGRRNWLYRVLRNSVNFAHRTATRRKKRENAVAVSEATPSESELLERLETAELVMAAVKELPTVYRQAILHRYWSDLTTREISDKLSVPVATVRTRLRRAREKLRASLEAKRGGDLHLCLLPLLLHSKVAATVSASSATSLSSMGGIVMVKKLTVAKLVVGALLGVYIWSVDSSTGVVTSDEMETADAEGSGPEAPEVVGDQTVGRGPEIVSSPESVLPEPPPQEPAPSAAESTVTPTEGKSVHGRIVAYDLGGNRVHFNVCEFELLAWSRTGKDVSPDIQGETWRAVVPPNSKLEFRGVLIDGLPALAREGRYSIGEASEMEVEVDLVGPRVFVVRDAETREELVDVSVVTRRQIRAPRDVDAENVLVEGERSPVQLFDDRGYYFVGAPNYAWGKVKVKRKEGGTYEVLLQKAASVRIAVHSHDVEEGGYVTLNRVRSGAVFMADPLLLEKVGVVHEASHIAPGEYEARLQERRFHPSQALWAATRFELRAGEERAVELKRGSVHGVEDTVEAHGTIRVERRWLSFLKTMEFRAWKRKRSAASKTMFLRNLPVEGEEEVEIPWSIELEPGKYVLELIDIQLRRVIDSSSLSEPIDIDLTALELAEASVRVIDGRTGENLEPPMVSWLMVTPSGLPRYAGGGGGLHADEGVYRFLSLPGSGMLSANVGRHAGRQSVTLRPGRNDVTLELSSTSGVRFLYECDGVRVALPDRLPCPELVAIGGAGKPERRSSSGLEVSVSKPGRYRVDFKKVAIEGYAPIAEREIDIPDGEWMDVVVELVKRREE